METYRSPEVTGEYQAKQRTDDWLRARMGKFTGSNAWKLMTDPRTKAAKEAGELSETAKAYILEKACEIVTGEPIETYQSAAMLQGIEREPEARDAYRKLLGCEVTEVGFIEGAIKGTGCSVDGIIEGYDIIEIKCPERMGHIVNLMIDSEEQIDKKTFYQMQWNMWITGAGRCEFVSYNPDFPERLRMKVLRILADKELQMEFAIRVTKAIDLRDKIIKGLKAL